MNDSKIIGNLCRDPESFGTNGIKLAVATSDGYYDKSKTWIDKGSDFHNVTCNGYVATKMERMGLKKGDPVFIVGSVRYKKPKEKGGTWYYNFEAKEVYAIMPKERKNDNPEAASGNYPGGF